MKRHFCNFILFLLATSPLIAQRNINQKIIDTYLEEAGDHAALYYAPLEEPFSSSLWINHPFWNYEESRMGDVCFDGVLYRNVMMRFNVATQKLAVATAKNKVLVTPDVSKIDYFILFGKRFEPRDGKFWCLEYSSQTRQLWHEKTKTKGQSVEKNNHSYNSYVETDKYFVNDGKEIFPVKKGKDIAKHYPQYRKQVMKFIRTLELPIGSDRIFEIISTLDFLEKIDH